MKFSVIIPLYNKEPYVRKALESVCLQIYSDYELIVINDGSTDNSCMIAEEYLQGVDDINYRLITQENAGVSAARNNGIAASIGEYVAFLDADDWWEPTFLEKMAQLISDYPEAGFYASNYMYYKPGNTHVAVNNIETGFFNYPKAYYEGGAMPVTSISVVIPRKVLDEMGGFPVGIKLGEDFLLWAKIAVQCPVAFLNEPLAWYNNDVPATLRATRNLHEPEHHMLFRLELLGDEAIRRIDEENSAAVTTASTPYTLHSTPTNDDWSRLIDKLCVNGLLDYWLDKRYHDQAAAELQKVDWSKQPANVVRIYKTPIWLLKTKRLVMKVGSIVKQMIYKRNSTQLNTKSTQVIINPRGNILYKSFYIKGLIDCFGEKNITYSDEPFLNISAKSRNGWDILFVVKDEHKSCKYYISCNDSYGINDEIYNWCDVYGSVNANYALIDTKYHSKLISLCPSFGIRCWSILNTIFHSITDYRKEVGSIKKHLGKYRRLLTTRRNLLDYAPLNTEYNNKPYVFFCSTMWYNDELNKNDEGVNKTRANFIRACKGINNLVFEGGLVPQSNNRSSIDKFADILYDSVNIDTWLEKTKRSFVVFNTPAFWNCHGWKLGEYLALGKCIISTKLSNDLPYPLEHGKNIHFVENTELAIKEAIEYIIANPEYKYKLEEGAREYWNKYGTPLASMKLLGIKQ